NGKTELNPAMHTVIDPDDKLVVLAEDDSMIRLSDKPLPVDESAIVHSFRGPLAPERTLILGWNERAAKIIEQLDIYVTVGSAGDVVTDRLDADTRLGQLTYRLRRITVSLKEGDTRDRNMLESLDISSYDNVIVLSD